MHEMFVRLDDGTDSGDGSFLLSVRLQGKLHCCFTVCNDDDDCVNVMRFCVLFNKDAQLMSVNSKQIGFVDAHRISSMRN
jgi:hypothetical protein